MPSEKKKITCCRGRYHILMDGTFYCMAPPDVQCSQVRKGSGKFTRGDKKIFYCTHHQQPCAECSALSDAVAAKE